MFGFVIGTVSLVALIKVLRRGGGWHGRGFGRHGGWGGRSGGPRRWMMRRLFERLDTTPGQEKVIAEVVDEMETAGRAARDEFMRARSEYAKAMKAEHFDTEAVRIAFEKQQAAVEEVKKAAIASMQKVHEALTPEQRAQVGDLFEFGPRAFAHGGGCGGGFRHAHHHGFRPGAVNL